MRVQKVIQAHSLPVINITPTTKCCNKAATGIRCTVLTPKVFKIATPRSSEHHSPFYCYLNFKLKEGRCRLDVRGKFFFWEGGEVLEQIAQRDYGCCVPEGV